MDCNTAQKEIGGKEILLKACEEAEYTTDGTTANITSTGHGLKIGDVVNFKAVGSINNLLTSVFYYVVAVTTNTYQVSATIGGTAIIPSAAVTDLAVDHFKSVGGLRSKSFSFQSESIDITNQESNEWKTILDLAGIRSFNVSGSGVYTAEAVFQKMFTNARNNKITCLMFIDVKSMTIFAGCFKISSLEVSGDFDAEGQYSISADSSGEIVVQNAA